MAESSQYNIDVRQALQSLERLEQEYKQVGDEVDRLDKQTATSFRRADSSIKGTRQETDKLDQSFTDLKKNGKESMSGVKQEADGLGKLFGNLKGQIAGAFAVSAVVGFANQMRVAAKETNRVRQQLKTLFKVGGEGLNELTKQSQVLTKVYNVQADELNKATKVFQAAYEQQGLSAQRAFELVDDAFAKGANVRGEFLEILKEYPAQLQQVGFSADEALAVITQTEQAGIFSDKGIDAIKEAGIRLRELTKPTQDALNAIGLSADSIQKGLQDGSLEMTEVIQKVSKRIKELPDNSQQVGMALADIFGAAGEDAGLGFIKGLSDIEPSLDAIESSATETTQAQRELAETWAEITTAATEGGGVIQKAYAGALNIINDVLEFLQKLGDNIAPVKAAFQSVIKPVKAFWQQLAELAGKLFGVSEKGNAAKAIMNALGTAIKIMYIPVKVLYQSFASLLTGINNLIDRSPTLQGWIDAIRKSISRFATFLTRVPAYISGFQSAAFAGFKAIGKLASDVFGGIGDTIAGVFSFDPEQIKQGIANTKAAFSDYGDQVGGAFRKAFADSLQGINKDIEKSAKGQKPAGTPTSGTPTGGTPTGGGSTGGSSKETTAVESFGGDAPEQIATRTAKVKVQPDIEMPDLEGVIDQEDTEGFMEEFMGDFNLQEVQGVANDVISLYQQTARAKAEAADKAVQAREKEISSLQREISQEKSLKKQGLANDLAIKQKELQQAKQAREKALQREKEAQQQRQKIQNAEQASSIITAVANLIQQWSSMGPFGHVLGLAQVGIMLAKYAATKQEAKQLRKGETGIQAGLLRGPAHEAGGIDMGGGYEAEGNEYVSVTPKSQAKEHLPLLEAIRVNDKLAMAEHLNKLVGDKQLNTSKRVQVKEQNKELRISAKDTAELSRIRALLEQNSDTRYEDGYRIEQKGSQTKRIKLK